MKRGYKIYIYQSYSDGECKNIGKLNIHSDNVWKFTEEVLKIFVDDNNDKNIYADVYKETDEIGADASNWLYRIFYKE